MRGLFECGPDFVQIGADYASLEARIQGSYVYNYTQGKELAAALIAEKPNDVHAFPITNQLLTPFGWKALSDLSENDLVAEYHKNILKFVKPTNIILRPNNLEDLMYEFTGSFNFKMTTTNKHRILLLNKNTNEYLDVLAEDLDIKKYSNYVIPISGVMEDSQISLDLSDNLIKLIVATQADGHLNKDSSAISFTFVKQRKIARLLNILNTENIPYTVSKHSRYNRYETTIRLNASIFTIKIRNFLTSLKQFSNELLKLPYLQKLVFLEELQYWDGTKTKYGTVVFDTTDHVSSEFVHTLARLSNLNTRLYQYTKNTSFGTSNINRVVFSQYPACVPVSSLKIRTYQSTDLVGCVQVPSTYLLVKENNSIFVSGNCLSEDTQILTKEGWKYFKDISLETRVAQWHKDNKSITYTYPSDIIVSEYQGDMINVEGERLSILMTPNHRNIVINPKTKKYEDILAKDLTNESGIIPAYGLLFNNPQIYKNYLYQDLLDKFLKHNSQFDKRDYTVFKTKSGIVFRSISREIIEQIQTTLSLYNVQAFIFNKELKKNAFDSEFTTYYQTIMPFKTPNLNGSDLKHTTITTVPYSGNIYCVTVNSSYIVCRRNGKIFITGNSLNAAKLGISRDAAKNFGYACLPVSTTKISTNNGFKYFKDLHQNDLIQNFDLSTNLISYEPIIDNITYQSETLYNIQLNNGTSVKATIDHKWLVFNKDNKTVSFVETKDLTDKLIITDCNYLQDKGKFNFDIVRVNSIEELTDKEEVFCITTNSSLYFIEQDNYTGLTGNCMYGAQAAKLAKMLAIDLDEAEILYEKYWDAVPALKELKQKVEQYWNKEGQREYLPGIDGRKLNSRSKHSLIESN